MAKKKKRSSKKKVTRSNRKSTKKKAKKTKKTTRKSKAVKKKTKKTAKRSKAVEKKAKKTKKRTKVRKAVRVTKKRPIVISKPTQQKPHDGLVAFLLEFVIGILGILGIGHIYNGKYSKGLFFMVGLWAYLLLIAVILKVVEGASDNKTLVGILLLIWLVILLSSSYNAFKDARG